MPDARSHRGSHPEDGADFGPDQAGPLRMAVAELSYLLTRNYSDVAALKLVGDRHQLTARQRKAVFRAACSDVHLRERRKKRLESKNVAHTFIGVDGFNCLITLEAMLSHAPIFRGRDGALRDLASVHGTYRRVEETVPAFEALKRTLLALEVRGAHFFFDRPVGNSGRIKALALELFRESPLEVSVSLHDQVDKELVGACPIVASSDGWVIDHAEAWVDLPHLVAMHEALPLWLVDLSSDELP